MKVLGPVTSEMAVVSRYPVSALGGRQGLKVPGPKENRWTAGFEGTQSYKALGGRQGLKVPGPKSMVPIGDA